jgi:hypothetical protein
VLAKTALAEQQWEQAEAELLQALAVLEEAEAPLAAWRVYASAAQFYEQRGRSTEARQYWTRSAAVRTRLADSLGNTRELRQSLLAYLPEASRACAYQQNDEPPLRYVLAEKLRPAHRAAV